MRKNRVGILTLAGLLALTGMPGRASGQRMQPGRRSIPVPVAQPAAAVSYDDQARFMSGLPCQDESLKKLQETEEWKQFAAEMDKSWAELEAKRLRPMRAWAAAEFPQAFAAAGILFYPFGGPDFLTAGVLFPQVETYVLLGLEFVGRLPDFSGASGERIAGYGRSLALALRDFFNKSYFITNNMNAQLARDQVDGILPVLCFFVERGGYAIVDVKRLDLLENGELMASDFQAHRKRTRRPYGVQIEFVSRDGGRSRTLIYISGDLENAAFRPETAFYRYVQTLPFEMTFIKSASYLLHYDTFSRIRDLILEKSRFVLQDDTGVPYRYFEPETWEAQLYGEYIKPVRDFSGVEQTDLKAAYGDAAKVRPLPFHLGYHWGSNKDSILLFRRLAVSENKGPR